MTCIDIDDDDDGDSIDSCNSQLRTDSESEAPAET